VSLQVEKQAAPASLYLADGTLLAGRLYLAPSSATGPGPQTVEELMAEPTRVLPFRTSEGGLLLVGKRVVAAVSVALDSNRPAGFWTPIPVSLRLAGPHRVEGNLVVEEGTGYRLSDFLNAAGPWIAVESGACLVWVSMDQVIALEPRGA
jgi:hypothetical protein